MSAGSGWGGGRFLRSRWGKKNGVKTMKSHFLPKNSTLPAQKSKLNMLAIFHNECSIMQTKILRGMKSLQVSQNESRPKEHTSIWQTRLKPSNVS